MFPFGKLQLLELILAVLIIVFTNVACFREASYLEDQNLVSSLPQLANYLRAITIVSDLVIVFLVLFFRTKLFVVYFKIALSCAAAVLMLVTAMLSFTLRTHLINSFEAGVSASKDVRDTIHCCLWDSVNPDCEFQTPCKVVITRMYKKRVPVFQGLTLAALICWIGLAVVFFIDAQMLRPRQPFTKSISIGEVGSKITV